MTSIVTCRNIANVIQMCSRFRPKLGPFASLPSVTMAVPRMCLHTGRRCQKEARSVIKPTGMAHSSQSKSKKLGGGAIFMLAIPVISFSLGVWQVRRRKWKLALIADMGERSLAAPVDFPSDLHVLDNLEYRKVKVTGHFDHSRELYMRPRSPVESSPGAVESSGLISAGQIKTGSYVVTPFILADSGVRTLVNRGWVPREKTNPKTRQEGQVDKEVTFDAVVRHDEKRPQFTAKNDVANNYWMHRDVNAMSQVLDTAPVFLDADAKSTVAGGPIGGQTKITLRNDHLQYLLTWFTLSSITSYMWYAQYWVRR